MDEWQDWIPCRVEGEEFPCLCELSISNCPKLEGKFPHHLPSLEKLSSETCQQLVVSIPNHPVLQVLKIVGCKEVVHGSVKVEKLIIKNCEKLTSLCEDELMSLATLEIKIQSCPSLVNMKLKSTLRKLTISYCSALESLEFVIDEGGASSTSSLLMNEENLSCIGNNNAPLLEHLEISYCPSLKCVSTIVDLAAKLKRLQIQSCPNLTSLSPKDTLPTTLKVLWLNDCPKLKSVDKLDKDTLLEDLFIWGCEKLSRNNFAKQRDLPSSVAVESSFKTWRRNVTIWS
nr:putative adenylate cyclase regulatory protein [Quercus suber]